MTSRTTRLKAALERAKRNRQAGAFGKPSVQEREVAGELHQAARALGEFPQRVWHGNISVQDALELASHPSAVQPLLAIAHDESSQQWISTRATNALATIPHPLATYALAILSSSNTWPHIKQIASAELSKRSNQRAAITLALRDERPPLRLVHRFRSNETDNKRYRTRKHAVLALGALGPAGWHAARKLLTTGDDHSRQFAAVALHHAPEPASIRALLKALYDATPRVCENAADSLIRLTTTPGIHQRDERVRHFKRAHPYLLFEYIQQPPQAPRPHGLATHPASNRELSFTLLHALFDRDSNARLEPRGVSQLGSWVKRVRDSHLTEEGKITAARLLANPAQRERLARKNNFTLLLKQLATAHGRLKA